MTYNYNQTEVIKTVAPRVVVLAAAAAGKTAVLVERLRFLLERGIDPTEIVALTFTNAAAAEIIERVGRPKGLFVGTIHSYCNYLLRSGGIDTSDILEQEKFDRLFKRIKENPQCTKFVRYLLLDEAQDSTPEQFEFVLDIVAPANWMLVGDYRQSLYGWKGASPKTLIDLSKCYDVKVYHMDQNYRNCKNILDYAKNIIRTAGIDYIDTSVNVRQDPGKVIVTEHDPVALARFIKKTDRPGDWFVLTRTNDELDVFSKFLVAEKIPFDTFKRAQLDNTTINDKMKEDTVKLLTIHTAKGLEAKNVAVIGARFYNTEEKCCSYVAATRARDLLVWSRPLNKPQRQKQVSSWE